jgi:hypothetical protein
MSGRFLVGYPKFTLERISVRRIPAVFLLCLGIALAGAAPSRPAVKATPTPSPTPTLQPVSLPIVVVYPFGASSDIAAGNGEKAANLFVQEMNNAGGIDAIGAPASVVRNDYLKYAKSVNADYYVTGYMTPLGNGVSLVEQVVSTRSGAMIFGQTAQVESFEDASSQAIAIHDGIMAQERGLRQQYEAAQATATATPMANNQANLGKGLSGIAGLFKRKGKSSPTPTPVVKPAKGILVAHVNGSVPANNLSAATNQLYNALNRNYLVRMTNSSGANITREADSLCGSNRNNTIATGTLSAKTTRHTFRSSTEWTFNLDIYTCWGAKLYTETATAGSLSQAVSNAAAAYAKDHPGNS